MTITTSIPAVYDHLDRCVGCGEDSYQGCGTVAGCPLLNGEVTPAIVLRAAAQRLRAFPIHRGADVSAAIAAAAIFFAAPGRSGALDADDLIDHTRTALAEYIDSRSLPAAFGPHTSVIDSLGRTMPRSMLAAMLYLAAAFTDQADYEPEDGEFDSYDD